MDCSSLSLCLSALLCSSSRPLYNCWNSEKKNIAYISTLSRPLTNEKSFPTANSNCAGAKNCRLVLHVFLLLVTFVVVVAVEML